MAKRATPEVNAGSMADIAFLLLIFYLVTTTMDVDTGLQRRLPPIQENNDQKPPPIKKKNILQIVINANDDILLGENIIKVPEIKQEIINFLDNNGDGTCSWCRGEQSNILSDNPSKAIVSLINDRSTTFGTYIAVQNEIVAAYNFLRNRYAKERYGKSWNEFQREEMESPDNEDIAEKVKNIKNAFPLNISEAEPVDYSK